MANKILLKRFIYLVLSLAILLYVETHLMEIDTNLDKKITAPTESPIIINNLFQFATKECIHKTIEKRNGITNVKKLDIYKCPAGTYCPGFLHDSIVTNENNVRCVTSQKERYLGEYCNKSSQCTDIPNKKNSTSCSSSNKCLINSGIIMGACDENSYKCKVGEFCSSKCQQNSPPACHNSFQCSNTSICYNYSCLPVFYVKDDEKVNKWSDDYSLDYICKSNSVYNGKCAAIGFSPKNNTPDENGIAKCEIGENCIYYVYNGERVIETYSRPCKVSLTGNGYCDYITKDSKRSDKLKDLTFKLLNNKRHSNGRTVGDFDEDRDNVSLNCIKFNSNVLFYGIDGPTKYNLDMHECYDILEESRDSYFELVKNTSYEKDIVFPNPESDLSQKESNQVRVDYFTKLSNFRINLKIVDFKAEDVGENFIYPIKSIEIYGYYNKELIKEYSSKEIFQSNIFVSDVINYKYYETKAIIYINFEKSTFSKYVIFLDDIESEHSAPITKYEHSETDEISVNHVSFNNDSLVIIDLNDYGLYDIYDSPYFKQGINNRFSVRKVTYDVTKSFFGPVSFILDSNISSAEALAISSTSDISDFNSTSINKVKMDDNNVINIDRTTEQRYVIIKYTKKIIENNNYNINIIIPTSPKTPKIDNFNMQTSELIYFLNENTNSRSYQQLALKRKELLNTDLLIYAKYPQLNLVISYKFINTDVLTHVDNRKYFDFMSNDGNLKSIKLDKEKLLTSNSEYILFSSLFVGEYGISSLSIKASNDKIIQINSPNYNYYYELIEKQKSFIIFTNQSDYTEFAVYYKQINNKANLYVEDIKITPYYVTEAIILEDDTKVLSTFSKFSLAKSKQKRIIIYNISSQFSSGELILSPIISPEISNNNRILSNIRLLNNITYKIGEISMIQLKPNTKQIIDFNLNNKNTKFELTLLQGDNATVIIYFGEEENQFQSLNMTNKEIYYINSKISNIILRYDTTDEDDSVVLLKTATELDYTDLIVDKNTSKTIEANTSQNEFSTLIFKIEPSPSKQIIDLKANAGSFIAIDKTNYTPSTEEDLKDKIFYTELNDIVSPIELSNKKLYEIEIENSTSTYYIILRVQAQISNENNEEDITNTSFTAYYYTDSRISLNQGEYSEKLYFPSSGLVTKKYVVSNNTKEDSLIPVIIFISNNENNNCWINIDYNSDNEIINLKINSNTFKSTFNNNSLENHNYDLNCVSQEENFYAYFAVSYITEDEFEKINTSNNSFTSTSTYENNTFVISVIFKEDISFGQDTKYYGHLSNTESNGSNYYNYLENKESYVELVNNKATFDNFTIEDSKNYYFSLIALTSSKIAVEYNTVLVKEAIITEDSESSEETSKTDDTSASTTETDDTTTSTEEIDITTSTSDAEDTTSSTMEIDDTTSSEAEDTTTSTIETEDTSTSPIISEDSIKDESDNSSISSSFQDDITSSEDSIEITSSTQMESEISSSEVIDTSLEQTNTSDSIDSDKITESSVTSTISSTDTIEILSSSKKSSSKNGLKWWAVLLIVLGSIAAISLLLIILKLILNTRRKSNEQFLSDDIASSSNQSI